MQFFVVATIVKGMVMKPDTFLCSKFLLSFLALNVHKPQKVWKNVGATVTNRNIPVKLFTRSVNVKEKIVQGCAPSNINCSSFVIAFEVRRLF